LFMCGLGLVFRIPFEHWLLISLVV
jgi:hypothetical protein